MLGCRSMCQQWGGFRSWTSAQTYDDTSDAAAVRRVWPPCGPNWPSAGWTVLWCPHSDQHMGEYLPAYAERLAWLTRLYRFGRRGGGADGQSCRLRGRPLYAAGPPADRHRRCFEPRDLVGEGPQGWIPDNLPQGHEAGFDPGFPPPMA